MAKNNLLEAFRSFYFQNYPDDMETQISYFAIFGGLDIQIETTKDIFSLIEEHILQNFENILKMMEHLTLDEPNNKRLLRALAVGDRRIFSAFKRAGLNNGNGGGALKYLQERGLIQIEYSREAKSEAKKLKRALARHRISHKVLFTYPFVRFWFYFVYPHIKEIKELNYTEFFEDIKTRQNSYTSLVFEELSEILLNYHLRDAQIVSSGSYWDANLEIDILTLTDDGRIYVGECKWSNHRVNKKELHKLTEKCQKLQITPNQIILFSKRGFSKELQNSTSKELALYSAEDFKILLKSSNS